MASNMLLIITYSRMVFWLMLSVTYKYKQVALVNTLKISKPPMMLWLTLADSRDSSIILPD